MKVITVLGKGRVTEEKCRAYYYYDEKLYKKLKNNFPLKKENYTNTFPLLLHTFGKDNVLAIYTEEAENTQKKVLESEFPEDSYYQFDKKYFIEDEKKFHETFKILVETIDIANNEEIILDLTHSFRHIPILATIALVSKNLQGIKNLKHILFAKEIEQYKKYEIIDLKEYLEIANLSIILENFSQNYTIASAEGFTNKDYIDLVESLGSVSNAILANSIKLLYNDNLLQQTKLSLEKISENEMFVGYKSSINKTIEHIDELIRLESIQDYVRLFEISKLMKKRGYLLNAITLFYEATSFYCAFSIENISDNTKQHVSDYWKTEKSSVYIFTNDSRRMLTKYRKNNDDPYLFNPERLGKTKSQIQNAKAKGNKLNTKIIEIKNEIYDYFELIENTNIEKFKYIIHESKRIRDNLAHANSGESIDNATRDLQKLHIEFESLCIKKDILNIKR